MNAYVLIFSHYLPQISPNPNHTTEMTSATQVTYGGIVTGIGSALVVSSLAYWLESGDGGKEAPWQRSALKIGRIERM